MIVFQGVFTQFVASTPALEMKKKQPRDRAFSAVFITLFGAAVLLVAGSALASSYFNSRSATPPSCGRLVEDGAHRPAVYYVTGKDHDRCGYVR